MSAVAGLVIAVLVAVGGDGEDALAIPPDLGSCERYATVEGVTIMELTLPLPERGFEADNVISFVVPTPVGEPHRTDAARQLVTGSAVAFVKETGEFLGESIRTVADERRLRAAVEDVNDRCG
jgi:hypothetical protein